MHEYKLTYKLLYYVHIEIVCACVCILLVSMCLFKQFDTWEKLHSKKGMLPREKMVSVRYSFQRHAFKLKFLFFVNHVPPKNEYSFFLVDFWYGKSPANFLEEIVYLYCSTNETIYY